MNRSSERLASAIEIPPTCRPLLRHTAYAYYIKVVVTFLCRSTITTQFHRTNTDDISLAFTPWWHCPRIEPVPFPEDFLRWHLYLVLNACREGEHFGFVPYRLAHPLNERQHIGDVWGPSAMRDRIAGAVRPVMRRDEVAGLYQVETVKEILCVIRTFPLRQTQLHVNEKVDLSPYVF